MSKINICLSSKIILTEVMQNKEYLEKRQKDLEEIKLVTSQLREISKEMGLKVKDQGFIIGNNI